MVAATTNEAGKGISAKQWEEFTVKAEQRLGDLRGNYKDAVETFLFDRDNAVLIAAMSVPQRLALAERLAGLASYTQIERAAYLGAGMISPNLARFISPRAVARLPRKDKRILADPNAMVAIKIRNSVRHKRVGELTKGDYRKIMKSRDAINGLRPPERQNDPSGPAIYYGFLQGATIERGPSPGTVILRAIQGGGPPGAKPIGILSTADEIAAIAKMAKTLK